jgi:hypothetical protein
MGGTGGCGAGFGFPVSGGRSLESALMRSPEEFFKLGFRFKLGTFGIAPAADQIAFAVVNLVDGVEVGFAGAYYEHFLSLIAELPDGLAVEGFFQLSYFLLQPDHFFSRIVHVTGIYQLFLVTGTQQGEKDEK